MSYIEKEFVLDRQENFDDFITSIKLDIDIPPRKVSSDFKPVTKLLKNGDKYTFSTTKYDGSTHEATFANGDEFDDIAYGKKARSKFFVNGDTITQVQVIEGYTFTIKREFSDKEIVVTLSHDKWDGQAKRYYKLK